MRSSDTVLSSAFGGKAQLQCDGTVREEMAFVNLKKCINVRPAKLDLKTFCAPELASIQ